jgi:hypothetical protein
MSSLSSRLLLLPYPPSLVDNLAGFENPVGHIVFEVAEVVVHDTMLFRVLWLLNMIRNRFSGAAIKCDTMILQSKTIVVMSPYRMVGRVELGHLLDDFS